MKNLTLFLILSLIGLEMSGQDLNISQYAFYRDGLNPSSFTQENDVNVFMLFNNEFWGFAQQPATQLADVSLNLNNHKLGLMVLNDLIGFDKTQNVKLRFAKKFNLSSLSSFSLGLGAGAIHKTLQATRMSFETEDDPLSYSDYSHTVLDFDFGAELQMKNLFLGLSASHLGKPLTEFENTSPTPHYYAYGQYSLDSKSAFRFFPNVLFRYWKKTYWAEAGLIVFYKNLVWMGSSYTTCHDLNFSAGLRITKSILFGYAFKSNMNSQILKPWGTTTHEIFLNFGYNSIGKSIKTPRFL